MSFCRTDKEANECKHSEWCRKGCQYQIVNGMCGQARNQYGQLFMFVCIKEAKKFKKDNKLHGKHRIVPVRVDYASGENL